jgi:two-component system, LytTR family, response regulator
MVQLNKIKTIIIDDSAQARKLLRLMLAELADDVFLIGEAENATEGFELITKLNPDVVFLDIEMPGKSGLQLVEELNQINTNLKVIFTTAYNEFAIKAFRLSAVDYLLKPIVESHLVEALNKIRTTKLVTIDHSPLEGLQINLRSTVDQVLTLPIQNGYDYIPIDDIEYLEADGSYVTIHFANSNSKIISKNLKYFENLLTEYPSFCRIHRSYIININQMIRFEKTDRGKISMQGGATLFLSRERREPFMQRLKELKKI